MPAGHDGRDGLDPLMAVLTGEPLPDEARADGAFLAEYRAAEADVTLLREQLGRIGAALAEPPPGEPAPAPAPRKTRPTSRRSPAGPARLRRRPGARALSLGVLVTAVAAGGVVGIGWLTAHPPGDASGGSSKADVASGSARPDAARYLACARLVVEGTVTAVRPGPRAGQERVTLRVTRAYKPGTVPADVTFTWEEYLDPRPGKGQHALVGIPRNADVPDTWVVDPQELAQERDRLDRALSGATAATCE
ncbi:hypothetical protein C3489_15555 [Streptomyces sp. Ru71]|uniref:hypothetical protein n=1 Tax=Streptomyces sp. Ru71 TaxID=2080746 RepID=UPI000CDD9B24|nr:hypothetical protein [Streptomyces sp. Ru71]POX53558.1 hypothetical protein C3489_15555 [Streptomyces sp. Ru71]